MGARGRRSKGPKGVEEMGGRRTNAVETKTVPESAGSDVADVDEVEDGVDVSLVVVRKC